MIRHKLQVEVFAHVQLSFEQFQTIYKSAQTHYDFSVRQIASPGPQGWLWHYKHLLEIGEVPTLVLDERKTGMIIKAMEQPIPGSPEITADVINSMHKIMRSLHRYCPALNHDLARHPKQVLCSSKVLEASLRLWPHATTLINENHVDYKFFRNVVKDLKDDN